MQQWDIVMETSTVSLPETANKEKKGFFHFYNYFNSATYVVVSSTKRGRIFKLSLKCHTSKQTMQGDFRYGSQ
jgi:hypothetical protein